MSTIFVEKINEVHLRVYSDDFGVEQELSEYFKYEVPGAKFMPSYKAKIWDGFLKLYNIRDKTLYVGLLDYLILFANNNSYNIQYPESLQSIDTISLEEITEFAKNLNLHGKGVPIEIRDYQLDAILHSLNYKRCILLSPTGSGKSLILYTLIRWHLENSRKVLLITPSVSLVEQMYSDFQDYSSNNQWCVEEHCQKLYSGFSKEVETDVLISTWQSIFRQSREWFDHFDVILGDECLHPDSMISMSDGTYKKICDIKVGDLVLTTNEITNVIESKPVIKVHKNISKNQQMYKVTLNNGNHIKITGNHKVLLTSGVWKRVDQLEIGDNINSIK